MASAQDDCVQGDRGTTRVASRRDADQWQTVAGLPVYQPTIGERLAMCLELDVDVMRRVPGEEVGGRRGVEIRQCNDVTSICRCKVCEREMSGCGIHCVAVEFVDRTAEGQSGSGQVQGVEE